MCFVLFACFLANAHDDSEQEAAERGRWRGEGGERDRERRIQGDLPSESVKDMEVNIRLRRATGMGWCGAWELTPEEKVRGSNANLRGAALIC